MNHYENLVKEAESLLSALGKGIVKPPSGASVSGNIEIIIAPLGVNRMKL